MKKALAFAMAMALGVSATAFAANPFSDLPQGHWAYAAVAELTADGVITGYPDGTFKGDQLMTRYEMAQIVAKALAKGSINNNDALVIEFADELDNLGVRVSNLEKKSDNIKLTGSLRYRYLARDTADWYSRMFPNRSELRSRIGITGAINDDWTYNALVENTKNFGHDIGRYSYTGDVTEFRRAWVEGKIGEVRIRAGRFNYIPQSSDIVISEAGNVFDDEIDGAKIGFKVGEFDTTLAYGRQNTGFSSNNLFIGTVGTEIGAVNTSLGYYNQESANAYLDDVNIFALELAGEVLSNTVLSGTALKGSKRVEGLDDFGYVLGLQYKVVDKNVIGSYSLSANYYNQPLSTYIMPSAAYSSNLGRLIEIGNYPEIGAGSVASMFDGFKGYRVGADYTVSKNMVVSLYYYDLKTREKGIEDKTILSQMNIFF